MLAFISSERRRDIKFVKLSILKRPFGRSIYGYITPTKVKSQAPLFHPHTLKSAPLARHLVHKMTGFGQMVELWIATGHRPI